jgi:hypothetical protein
LRTAMHLLSILIPGWRVDLDPRTILPLVLVRAFNFEPVGFDSWASAVSDTGPICEPGLWYAFNCAKSQDSKPELGEQQRVSDVAGSTNTSARGDAFLLRFASEYLLSPSAPILRQSWRVRHPFPIRFRRTARNLVGRQCVAWRLKIIGARGF